jgi:hypothetical protein
MPSNRGGRGGGPGNRQLYYAGTGSNNTPLGSPREFGRSPTTTTDKPAEEENGLTKTAQSEEKELKKGKKRKAAEDEVRIVACH